MLVEIFYHIDEFCKVFEKTIKEARETLPEKEKKGRKGSMSLSEIMTIVVYFHYSERKNFKSYYKNDVLIGLRHNFGNVVSYNRFVELMHNACIPLFLFLKLYAPAHNTGIFFVDSFALPVCHNRRINQHKTFKNIAMRGQTSMGWFYGFKVHLIINHLGEIVNFGVTKGNIADNNANLLSSLTKGIFGKMFGDKGYLLNRKFYETLYQNGLQFVTSIRSNMKDRLYTLFDKIMLKKRGIIETIIGILKQSFQIQHTRARSPKNYLTNVVAALAAYFFKPHKPSIPLSILALP